MRYSFYVFIKQLSCTVNDAFLHMKNSDNPLGCVGMLVDCAEAIDRIRKVLISNKGSLKDDTGIKLLDDESNIIDNIADKVEKNEPFFDDLDKLIDKAENFYEFTDKKIEVRYKVVFFAELGAKWDSIESVYKTVKNRSDCDVEVVIAPIFRAIKDKDGKVISDVIYNDFLTPMGIKHTLYKDYDIKKDLPDIVFTSQPYESVTTEQFWAENISKYTRLVYLPYGTFYGLLSDEEIYTQCMMPIHNLAWRVIVPNEMVKDEYSKYSKIKGKNIIATGLPKWDYVFNINDRKLNMPSDWSKKLSGKKVILWNTHYNLSGWIKSFFPWTNKMLEIVDGRDDIAVIWRYHPMLETMFKVYYPEYKNDWIELKDKIKKSKSVVIDNYECYDYAFYFSDVLLSAASSLITQYLFTGKPIYLVGTKESYEETENKHVVFFPYSKFPCIRLIEEQFMTVIKDVVTGVDEYKEVRENIIKSCMDKADGHIGKHIVNQLISEMKKEDEV